MRIRKLLFILACVLVGCPAWGEAVSEGEARQVASSFMSRHFKAGSNAGLRLAHRAPAIRAGKPSPFYVFNAEKANGGYVIVAGDDRVPQVLGYSDEGTFDINNIPEAMQEWLDGYAAQIAALDEGGMMASHITSSQPIAPLVKAAWAQRNPYNILLPFRPNGEHALTGCVATAMAQVMHYWQWPQRPSDAIPAYETETLHFNMPALPPVDFNWKAMQDTYFTTDTVSAGAQAVATLLLYCAQAVQMDFKEKTSSATTSDICEMLPKYFGYSPETHFIQRTYYTSEQWESIILDELKARRPVIYSASQIPGGHAFICDGYNGNGMFHFNWGWNGSDNGYFLLNLLNPELDDPGNGYLMRQGIIVGLKPGTATNVKPEVHGRRIEIKDYTNTRTSTSQNFTVTQETQFLNGMERSISFNYAWGLYQGNQLVKILEPGVKEDLQSWYYFYITKTLSLGSGISNGTFRIIPLYCELNSNEWRPCTGSDINFIEVTINGNNCSFTCYGTALMPDYKVNNISIEGNMHPNRPVYVTLNVTNKGYTRNDIIYMFANNKLVSSYFVDVPNAETCNVTSQYLPTSTGIVSLKFTLDQDGNNVLATHDITIDQMPSAYLSGSASVLNVTDGTKMIITANEFGIKARVINSGTTTYDEDITVDLYKWIYENRGTLVQTQTQHVVLLPHKTTELTFHLDNVSDGWNYFARVNYYSNGEKTELARIKTHTVVFPQAGITGDVNNDGVVNISDINVLVNMILTNNQSPAGDVNGDGQVNISDINATINIILKGS